MKLTLPPTVVIGSHIVNHDAAVSVCEAEEGDPAVLVGRLGAGEARRSDQQPLVKQIGCLPGFGRNCELLPCDFWDCQIWIGTETYVGIVLFLLMQGIIIQPL